jgi:hypothetical protein
MIGILKFNRLLPLLLAVLFLAGCAAGSDTSSESSGSDGVIVEQGFGATQNFAPLPPDPISEPLDSPDPEEIWGDYLNSWLCANPPSEELLPQCSSKTSGGDGDGDGGLGGPGGFGFELQDKYLFSLYCDWEDPNSIRHFYTHETSCTHDYVAANVFVGTEIIFTKLINDCQPCLNDGEVVAPEDVEVPPFNSDLVPPWSDLLPQ